MIDSHCHLADETFAADLDAVVARAREAGVERALVILAAGDAKEAARARRVEALWPEVRVSIGVHPHTAHEFADDPAARGRRRAPAGGRDAGGARDRRDRARLPLRLLAARRAAAGVPRAGSPGARARLAGRHPHARGRCRYDRHPARGRRRGPPRRAALLHRRRRPRPGRPGPGLLHLVCRASLRFRKRRRCGRRQSASRSIGCWPRPTARFWRRSLPREAERARPRRARRRRARRAPRDRIAGRPGASARRPTFTACSGRDKVHPASLWKNLRWPSRRSSSRFAAIWKASIANSAARSSRRSI